ncbi:MAG: hypothetical protein AB1476_03665 [Candidatus Hadarchaeota archaeon]
MSLKVTLHPDAEDDLRRIFKKDRENYRRIANALERYAETGVGDVRVVVGAKKPGERPLLALVVGKRWWRVFFSIADETIYVVHIERRPAAYQPWIVDAARRRLKHYGVDAP